MGNGGTIDRWALASKVVTLLVPLLLIWGAWATKSIYLLQPEQPRYTAADARNDHLLLMRDIDAQFSQLPPPDWRSRITQLEKVLGEVRDNQIKIMAMLGGRP